MAASIQFAVRDSAGGRQLGKVAGDEQSNFIQVGRGDIISLNVSPQSIVAYEQQGRDLVIKLADGRMVVLAGYFDPAGGGDALYLSADGQITEVTLTGSGEGVLTAGYGPVQPMEKWSPLDDLRFLESDTVMASNGVVDEPAGMGIFAPALLAGGSGIGAGALGLAGLGLLAGGDDPAGGGGPTVPGGGNPTVPGGGDPTVPGGSDPVRVPPTVNNPEVQDTLTTNTNNPTIVVTGTGQPGDTVVVTVGTTTVTTTITPEGTWGTTITGPKLPPDGTYSSTVVVSGPGLPPTTLDGPDYIIDMTPPAVSVTEGTKGAGDIENLVDYQNGVTIAGEGEVGAAIVVTVDGVSRNTVVNAAGTWTVTFTQTEVGGGERSTPVTVRATDALGNVTTITDTLVLDTIPNPVDINRVTADNTVSQSEFNSGFMISGTTAAGATITLELGLITRTVTAGADGSWSTTIAAGTILGGTYNATVTASTVDAAGNASSTMRTFAVDTEVTVAFAPNPIAGDNIVNLAESSMGVVVNGISQPGSTVMVQWGNINVPANSSADGSWTVTIPRASVPADGSTAITATATDSVGNTSSVMRTVVVDTVTTAAINPTQVGDNVVSGAERGAGFSLRGTAEAGATVAVTLENVTHTVIAGTDGTWTASYGVNEIRGGTYPSTVSITSTDIAGNTATATRAITVDTQTNVAFNLGQTGGDNIISGAERLAGITLTGMAEAGASVVVSFENAVRTVTAGTNGAWSANFAASDIAVGTRTGSANVTATDIYGNVATATHTIRTDTEVVPLTRATLSAGSDDVVNQAEAARGLTITGTVEPGSTVMVQFGTGAPRPASVATNGSWTAIIPTGDIPAGEATPTMTVTATDSVGNTRVHTETVQVDRLVRNVAPGATQLAGDGVLNAEEAAQGLVVNGTAEPGATVVIQISGGAPVTVTSGTNGLWSYTFTGTSVPRGEIDATVTVTATDRAGNVASYSQPLEVDTIAPGAPDIGGFHRTDIGVDRLTMDDATESYDFSRVNQDGTVTHINAIERYDVDLGTTNFTFGNPVSGGRTSLTPVPDGSYLVVNTEDLAGNESSTLVVINNTNAASVDLNRSGLTQFDFSAIDLTFAPDALLMITESQILNMTGADKTIVIKGGADDKVTIVSGSHAAGATQTIDGEVYNIYTVGSSGATVLLDADITVI